MWLSGQPRRLPSYALADLQGALELDAARGLNQFNYRLRLLDLPCDQTASWRSELGQKEEKEALPMVESPFSAK